MGKGNVKMKLTGSQILEILKFLYFKLDSLQVSGITFSYSAESERIDDVLIGGNPLDPERIYRIAMIDFLFYAARNEHFLKGGENVVYSDVARDVVEKYMRSTKSISAPRDNRIRIIGE